MNVRATHWVLVYKKLKMFPSIIDESNIFKMVLEANLFINNITSMLVYLIKFAAYIFNVD